MFNDLGSGSVACYLESAVVLAAAERLREDIATGCDLVVLNKFGKLEAAGGGLRDAFAHTDAGKALSFSTAGPVNGRRWRLPGVQTRDLRLLKTPPARLVRQMLAARCEPDEESRMALKSR